MTNEDSGVGGSQKNDLADGNSPHSDKVLTGSASSHSNFGQPGPEESKVIASRAIGGFGSSALSSSRGTSLVTARGTADGLILRLDARVDSCQLVDAVRDFLTTRKEFLSGNEVELEWLGGDPPTLVAAEIADLLKDEFEIRAKIADEEVTELNSNEDKEWAREAMNGDEADEAGGDSDNSYVGQQDRFEGRSSGAAGSKISSLHRSTGGESSNISTNAKLSASQSSSMKAEEVLHSKVSSSRAGALTSSRGEAFDEASKSVSLFGGVESISMSQEIPHGFAAFEGSGGKVETGNFDSSLWDDPDARIIFSTLRSGQKVETEHSLVICGDVNSGAEVIAGGDVIILGTLRGVAHAGAYDESGGGRFIFSLDMRPTQLRIGTVISRGSAEGGHAPEIARVEGDLITVEPYQTRGRTLRRQNVGNLS